MGQGRMLRCSHCGSSFLTPMGYELDPDKPFICPNCQKKSAAAAARPPATAGATKPAAVTKPAAAAPAAPAASSAAEMEMLLTSCPICGKSKVTRKSRDPEEHRFICGGCASVIEESIFGYQYAQIDDADDFRRIKENIAGKTFTLPDLMQLSNQKMAQMKAQEDAANPPEEEVSADSGEPAPPREEELYWQIDEEALAKREQQRQAAKRGVTIEDLLKEISDKKK